MTPLRKKMIEAMRMRGFSVRTHQAYLRAVSDLARYHRRCPATLTREEIEAYFRHLVMERALAPASCRVHLHGVRFLIEAAPKVAVEEPAGQQAGAPSVPTEPCPRCRTGVLHLVARLAPSRTEGG